MLTAAPFLLSTFMLNFSIQVNICHELFIYLNPTSISIASKIGHSHFFGCEVASNSHTHCKFPYSPPEGSKVCFWKVPTRDSKQLLFFTLPIYFACLKHATTLCHLVGSSSENATWNLAFLNQFPPDTT
jgi:hypothetical protein